MAKVQSDFYFRWAQDRIQETYTEDREIDLLIEYVGVDTTSNTVEIELPSSLAGNVLNGKKVWIIDQGNAGTNNVTTIPNIGDSTTIQGKTSFVLDKDGQTVAFELVDDQWLIFANTDRYVAFGAMGFSDNATDTVIVEVDTYVDIDGTIAVGDLERFSFNTNELEYTGDKTEEFRISVSFSVKKSLGASAREIRAALFIDSGSGFVEDGSAPMDMDNNIKSFGFSSIKELSKGDKVKMMIKNVTNDDDILIVTYDFVVTVV